MGAAVSWDGCGMALPPLLHLQMESSVLSTTALPPPLGDGFSINPFRNFFLLVRKTGYCFRILGNKAAL